MATAPVDNNGSAPKESPWVAKLRRPAGRPVLHLPDAPEMVRELANKKYPTYPKDGRLFQPALNCDKCFNDGLLPENIVCDCIFDQVALENMKRGLTSG